MIYCLTAFCVVLGSLFVPTLIGAILTGHKSKDDIIKVGVISVGVISSVVAFLLLWICYYLGSVGFYKPTPFVIEAVLGGLVGLIIVGKFTELEEIAPPIPPAILVGGSLVFVVLVFIFGEADCSNATKKAKLIGEVKVVTALNEAINPSDTTHIALVSEDMARIKANDGLSQFKVEGGVVAGSRYKIGDPTKVFVAGQQWWIFPVEFQGWLKWRQNPIVPGYIRVSAEDPYVSAQAVQTNLSGTDIKIKYLNSACWEYKAVRRARYNGYLTKIVRDWTFEPDDEWNPYYTASILERKYGWTGEKVVGVLTMNLQTGDIVEKSLDQLPQWIDRGIPLETLDNQIKLWGKYRLEGWSYNMWHDDKSQQPTPGWFNTISPTGKFQWFTGFTSMNVADKALTGFTLTDGRTGETVFFGATGVTEDIAYVTTRSLWSNFEGYQPTELVPYNINGMLTYVIPMTYQGQYKGVSLVALNNKDINGMGKTMEEALRQFRTAIARSNSGRLSPESTSAPIITTTGKVERVGYPIGEGENKLIPFTINGINKIFLAPYTFSSPKSLFIAVNEFVVITYLDTAEAVITIISLDIPNLVLNSENPEQR